MKIKLFIIALLFIAGSSTQAQVDVNVRTPNVEVHVGTNPRPSRPAPPPAPAPRPAPAPVWGPVGYDDVEYYYLPDIQVYYDIRLAQYIYFERGRWNRSRYLPRHCRNYDLNHGYKVVLTDYHGHSPYDHFHNHRVKYHKGYKGKPQQNRGEYKVHYQENNHHNNHNHDNHYNDHHNDHKHDHGNHNGHGNGHHDKHEGKGHNGKGKH